MTLHRMIFIDGFRKVRMLQLRNCCCYRSQCSRHLSLRLLGLDKTILILGQREILTNAQTMDVITNSYSKFNGRLATSLKRKPQQTQADLLEPMQGKHIHGSVQDCSVSSALLTEILQSCTKPSISFYTL